MLTININMKFHVCRLLSGSEMKAVQKLYSKYNYATG